MLCTGCALTPIRAALVLVTGPLCVLLAAGLFLVVLQMRNFPQRAFFLWWRPYWRNDGQRAGFRGNGRSAKKSKSSRRADLFGIVLENQTNQIPARNWRRSWPFGC